MSLCNCTGTTYILYDIAEISSFDKIHADINNTTMSIGTNSRGFKFRVLIKFDFNHLPKNIQILRAILSVNILNTAPKCKTHKVIGYTLSSNWSTSTVSWNNQPSINFTNELFEKSVNNFQKYTFDLTNQTKNWYEYPHTNYGMVLISSENNCYNKIQICTKPGSSSNLSLLIEYCIDPEIHVLVESTKFFEYPEDIIISPGIEYFTTSRDISLTKTVAYFIKNNNIAPITVIAENSPDNVNYAKEIQTIIIPPGSSSLLVPINFSKYIRLSIKASPGGNTTTINTWLQLQQ